MQDFSRTEPSDLVPGWIPSLLAGTNERRRSKIRTLENTETSSVSPVSLAWARRRARAQRLSAYIAELASRGLIAETTAQEALRVWSALDSATSGAMPIPNAAPGDEGQLMLAWDSGPLHLEVEFQPPFVPNLFFADRSAPESSWEIDLDLGANVPTQVLKVLSLFTESSNA